MGEVQRARAAGAVTLREALADRWLLALLAAGLALRIGAALWVPDDHAQRGDARVYWAGAEHLRETGRLETGHFVRPPLYFAALAAAGAIGRGLLGGGASSLALVQLLQALASAAAAVPVYRTAHRLGGLRVARVAAGLLLFDPTLVAFSHLLWPETLLLLLVAVLFDALPRLEGGSPLRRAAFGALFGAVLLLKPVLGLFALLLAGHWWLRLGPRRALGLVAVFGGAALLVVAPWAARNVLRYGPGIVLENQAPYNLWIGNDPRPPRAILDEWIALGDPVTRSRTALRRGWRAIRDDPGRFAGLAVGRVVNLWGLEFFVVRLPIVGGYPGVDRGGLLRLFWGVQAFHALLLLAAAAGLARAWRDPVLRLLLIYAAVFTALVAGLAVTTRFRVPFAFPLTICAALGVRRALAGELGRRDLAVVAAALALLSASASRPLFRSLIAGDFEKPADLDHPEWRYYRY